MSRAEVELVRARAVEAVIWGMPAVNFERLFAAMAKIGGRYKEIVYWSRLFDWRNQTLTPNPDTLYFLPFFDLSDGPMVLEIPPAEGGSITGSIMDSWQCALADVGPAGADAGAGGRYLLLPPEYTDAEPDGYICLACDTRRGYAVLRSNVASGRDEDVAAAADYGRRVRLYPLAQADEPPLVAFIDAVDEILTASSPMTRPSSTRLTRSSRPSRGCGAIRP